MDLEHSLAQKLINLKAQFDTLIEKEGVQHLEELDDVISTQELEKSQIKNGHVDQIALLEKHLLDFKLKVVRIKEFKVEAINVKNNLKATQGSFKAYLKFIICTNI